MADRLTQIVRVVRRPDLGRLLGAFAVFSIAENATWLAATVFAFQRGGVREAGLVAVIQLAPAVVLAPFAAYAGDRFRKDVVLTVGYVIQAATMLATAAAMAADASSAVVYGAAASAAVAVTFTRPAMGALLPAVTRTPAELTAGNVIAAQLENFGVFLGPMTAGLLMFDGEPSRVFAVMGAAMALAAIASSRLPTDESLMTPEDPLDAGDVAGHAWDGFVALARAGDVRVILTVLTLCTVLTGATDMLCVALANELSPDSSADRAGWFGAATGLGAVIAAAAAVVLVGRSRLALILGGCVAIAAAAVALLGAVDTTLTALLVFAAAGSMGSVAHIAGATLVQRVAPSAVLCRIFGIVEGLAMAALAVGAIVVSLLVDRFGLETGAVALGAMVAGVVVLHGPALRALDRRTIQPRPELIELVRAQEVFRMLPAPSLERMLAALEPREVEPGDTIIREGEIGDRFYLIESGRVVVSVAGQTARTLGSGGSFGEIALVRDVPRTATVVAAEPTVLQTLPRDQFLAALGDSRGLRLAQRRSEMLLGEDEARSTRTGS